VKLKQLEMFKLTASERGRRGYLATTSKMGVTEFHRAGGNATLKMYLWWCPCHEIGVEAYLQHHKSKGKRHRYGSKMD
jgi:hypothetical protein